MVTMRRRGLCFYPAVVALVCCWISNPVFADGPALGDFLANSDSPIYIRGDYCRALMVVYQDFSKILAKHRRNARFDLTEKRLSMIENYDVHIEQDVDNYTIHVAPTLRDRGQEVFGGAFTYVIKRKTFQIVEVTASK